MVRGDGDVPGLEDLNFFDKLDYQIDETATEIQGIDVEDGVVAPPPRSSRPNSRRRRTAKGRGRQAAMAATRKEVRRGIVSRCIIILGHFGSNYEELLEIDSFLPLYTYTVGGMAQPIL